MNKKLFYAFLIWTIVFWLAGVAIHARADNRDESTYAVNEYLAWFHSNVKESKLEKAKEYVPYVVAYAKNYEVDPLDVACLISFESSWRPRDGDAGEKGLMQVMPGPNTKGFDKTDDYEMLEAGIKHWYTSVHSCPTRFEQLTHYASGRCKTNSDRTKEKMKYRVLYMQWVKDRFRHGMDVPELSKMQRKGRTI